ncbi:hypothetical protein TDB9533_04322 [Thalassocella blandensis]|nr:hypothetical protein TDB9533_04322 [Thalassocella blandensis]
MKIKHLALASIIGLTGAFNALPAHAGTDVAAPVYINTSTGVVTGAMGYARHTSDSLQFIGCYSTGYSASCQARNTDGTLVTCYTNDTNHLEAIKSIGDDSRIYFRYEGGSCTNVYVYNYSYWRSR